MTAYLGKVDVERMFRQMASQPAAQPTRTSTAAEAGSGPWRVVGVDGSTSAFDPVGQVDDCCQRQPVSTGRDIAMPTAVPKLSEMIEADAKLSLSNVPERGHAVLAPKPGVGVSNHRPAKSLIPPQVSGRCRDIDSQLARIIDVWPKLPRSIRQAMLAMIEAAKEEG